ncbi:hypothetical protein VTI74DRAFT_777 [Chaetomium olivicolor]
MAWSGMSGRSNSTKANTRTTVPTELRLTIFTSMISPTPAKMSAISSSVTSMGSPPTKTERRSAPYFSMKSSPALGRWMMVFFVTSKASMR